MSAFDRAGSVLATLVRGGSGSRVVARGEHPRRRLVLYEMENCPLSRKAREALSMLDLDVEIRPCPERDRHHRPDLLRLTREEKVPVLIDPNTGSTVKESDRIVAYLFSTYGNGRKPPLRLRAGKLSDWTSRLASRIRGNRGNEAEPGRRPREPLELWGYEASPDTRLVREELSRYSLPYILHNAARGSPKRKTAPGKLPVLIDPNTGAQLDGASAARRYLARTYGQDGQARAMMPPRPETLRARPG